MELITGQQMVREFAEELPVHWRFFIMQLLAAAGGAEIARKTPVPGMPDGASKQITMFLGLLVKIRGTIGPWNSVVAEGLEPAGLETDYVRHMLDTCLEVACEGKPEFAEAFGRAPKKGGGGWRF